MSLFTFCVFFLSCLTHRNSGQTNQELLDIKDSSQAVSGKVWTQDTLFTDTLPAAFSSGWEQGPANSVGTCALACLHQSGCKSFFYNEMAKSCKMTSSLYTFQGNETSAPGFRYYKQRPTCPNAYYALHEPSLTCFNVPAMTASWTAARDTCAQLGGRLAVLDTASKANFLIQFLRAGSFTDYYYVGGHRPYDMWNLAFPGGMSDHVWLSGVPVDWASFRAAGLSNDNYGVSYNVVAVQSYTIIDHEHDHSHYFVCEFPAS